MKKRIQKIVVLGIALIALAACSSTQSLQEYYVDNSENPNFLAIDIPVSVLNIPIEELEDGQKEILNSFKKINVLAFKKTLENKVQYEEEKATVKTILKNKNYVDLMKLNTAYGKGVIKYLGEEDAIDEVIIYGDDPVKGFALIRVLGKNMNPAHMVQVINLLEKSNYKGEGLEGIKKLFK